MTLQTRRPTIGLLTYGAGDPNSGTVWSGVADAARIYDANLVCFPGRPLRSQLEFEAQANILYDLVGRANVDGLLIWLAGLSHWAAPEEVAAFPQRFFPLPVVTIGMQISRIHGVVVDNYGSMRAVVEHVIQTHKRKNIAFILGPARHEESVVRYRAYCDVLTEHAIPLYPELVVQGNFKESGGSAAAETLLRCSGRTFDALVAASDNMALGAMKALQANGVQIPGDVAVVGLNDERQSRYFTPPLTTGTLRFYEQAYRAAEMLLAMLNGQPVPEAISLPAQLLIRQSCGCPDPMLGRIGTAIRYAGGARSAEELACHSQEILDSITREIGTVITESLAQLTEQLWNGFLREITGAASGAFLEALRAVLAESAAAEVVPSTWQHAVTVLWREFGSGTNRSGSKVLDESMWQQARVLIGETAQRIQAYQVLQTEERTRKLGRINQVLSAAVDIRELADTLSGALPELGIPSCYLSLYEDPDVPADRSRLIMAYNHTGRVGLDPEGRFFPSAELVPAGLMDQDRRYSLVVEPLYFRQDQLGLAVFEADARREEVYELLSEEISGALKRTQLVARNIDLYHEAEKARQVAEEARREAEAGRQLAEEADRLKSRFLATVSHELRTPLSLIVGTIDMMRREAAQPSLSPPESYAQDLTSIHVSAQHLSQLIGDVLDLASGQAGELRLECESVQMAEVLTRVATLAEPLVREKGLLWQTDFPQDLPLVWGDRTRLQQVVLNLISNAVKFTECGSVTLWAEVGKNNIVIAVSDTGMGIPQAEQEMIFNEFRQSERTAQRGYGGMGLGLAISRHLVHLHGGQIGVLSTGAEDTGSTFYFTLPILAQAVTELGEPNDRVGKVLLLTDRVDAGVDLQDYLVRRGFEVERLVTTHNADWLSRILTSPPGALVVDYGPAVESGWEILRTLKLNLTTSELPLLFYGLPPGRDTGTLLELDYLSKPVEETRLAGALARHGLDTEVRRKQVILIVDDDLAILDLHTRMVRASLPCSRILRAVNGSEALQLMAYTRPDLVLLDLMMPVMDGFAVLETMRSSPQTAGIPVIVLTAQILTSQDMARLQRGVAAVLGKELFTTQEVQSQVEAALARSKRLGSEAQRIVRLTMAYIHEHYAEGLSRADLAANLAINERYLTRCFHDETGLAPFTYLLRYRLKQGRKMLEETQMGVIDIALAAGFADSSHFCRMFRKEFGLSPSAYRRAHRSSPSR